MTEDEVRAKVEASVIGAGSLRELARQMEISPSYLSDFLNGRRGPGSAILDRLGLVRVVTVRYVVGEATGRKRRTIR